MQLKSLLLDLDGTLVDTAPDMVATLNRILTKHNMPLANYNQARKLVSNGARALLDFGFQEHIKKFDVNELIDDFLTNYADNICLESRLYDGMIDVLELCVRNNIRWGVVTNKPLELSRNLLSELQLLEECEILLGGDSLPVKKPDPAPLLHCCMIMNLAPSECLYVGDHERDIIAGRAAGMDTAAALWGYINEQQAPENWQANFLLNQPSGLRQLINDRINQ